MDTLSVSVTLDNLPGLPNTTLLICKWGYGALLHRIRRDYVQQTFN